jgi:hypothetical protein
LLISEQIAIAYLACGLVGLITYISATIFVYAGEKDYERSVASSRASILSNTCLDTLIDKTMDSDATGPARDVDKLSAYTEPQRDTTSSTIVGEASTVKTTRAKVMVGSQHSEPPRRDSEKVRKSLLY